MLKEILSRLGDAQRLLLMNAFNTGRDCLVEYKPGYFVGVNLKPMFHLNIEEVVGRWSRGTLVGKTESQETDVKPS